MSHQGRKKKNKRKIKMLAWHKRYFPKGSLVRWEQIIPLNACEISNKECFGLVVGYDFFETADSVSLKLKVQTQAGITCMKVDHNFYRSGVKCIQMP